VEKILGPAKGLYQFVSFTEKINYYDACKALTVDGFLPADLRELIALLVAFTKDKHDSRFSNLIGNWVCAPGDSYTEGASADPCVPASYTAGPNRPTYLAAIYWLHHIYPSTQILVRLAD